MVVYHKLSKRKTTGGRYRISEKKRLSNVGSLPTFTKVGEKKLKVKREKSGSLKNTLLSINKINIIDPKTKKSQQTDVIAVVETPSNRNFVRRSIITKGTILDTKIGKVRVTSRPGQEGTLNGILIS